MNIPLEMMKLKKEIKLLNSRMKKIEKVIEKLKNMFNEKSKHSSKSRNRRRVVSYLHWLDNERKNRNLISND